MSNYDMTFTPGRRSLLASVSALGIAGLASACGSSITGEVPAVPAGPALESPTPAASGDQVARYVAAISETLTAADEAKDPSKLAPRVTGSAAEFRTKTYEIIAKVPEWTSALTGPSGDVIVAMTSTEGEWPRTALALTGSRTGDEVPYFLALHQADARSPYTTWGWAQQAVGVAMPTVPDALVGSAAVPADDDTLVMTPAAALARYAAVLGLGDAEDPDDLLAPNPFQTETHAQIAAEREQLNAGVERDEAATVGERYSVREGEYLGLRTDDGGAIVMGVLDSQRTVSIRGGATIRYSEGNVYTTLADRTEFTDTYVRQYGTTVALYIPTAEAGGQVQPIGVSRALLAVSGS